MREKNIKKASLKPDIPSIIKDLLRNCAAILLAGCIVWMGLTIYELIARTPQYTSTAVVAIRAQQGTTGAYAGLSTTSSMAKVFCEVFRQPSLKRLAAEHIGEESFAGTLSAAVYRDTNIINLSVTSGDPELSFRLINAVLEVHPEITEVVFANASVSVLQPPGMPVGASNLFMISNKLKISAAAAALMGVLVFFLSFFRKTVKNEEMYDEMINADLLGTIAHEAPHMSLSERLTRRHRPLLVDDPYTGFRFSEDYQRIVNKIEGAQQKNGSKVFAVTSVTANEGKTTSATNIALTLAARGYHVALLDLDVRKPSVHKVFNIKDRIQTDFADILSGDAKPEELRLFRCRKKNLYLAVNKKSRTDLGDWIGSPRAQSLISKICESMDYVIIDTSPVSVSADAVYLTEIADETILIVRTDVVLAEDINDAILTIEGSGAKLFGCILNDLPKQISLFGQMGMNESRYYRYPNVYSKANYEKTELEDEYADFGNAYGKESGTLRQESEHDE